MALKENKRILPELTRKDIAEMKARWKVEFLPSTKGVAFTVEGKEMTWEMRMLAYLIKSYGGEIVVDKKKLMECSGVALIESEDTIKCYV